MNSILIQQAEQVVSASLMPSRRRALSQLSILSNASIYIRNGRIHALGNLETVEKEITDDPMVIDGRGKTVLPGFIDSHTHLVFAGTREDEYILRLKGASYQEIAAAGGGILSTVKRTREASKEELVHTAGKYLQEALHLGTTTMEIKTGYGLDLENEIKLLEVISELNDSQPITLIPTFLGAHAVPPGRSVQQYTEEVIAMLPHIAGKAAFCDVFCEQGYFGLEETKAIFQAAKNNGLKLRLHADQLTNNNGVKLSVEMGVRSVDHLEQINEEEIELLAASETCATLLPGVSFFLHYGYPPARQLIDHGAIVCLASNFNPGSCMCLNMQFIAAIACTQMRMFPEEALVAMSANAAFSLDLKDRGIIAPGYQADLLICNVTNYKMIPYFFGKNHVEMVIKEGKVVVG